MTEQQNSIYNIISHILRLEKELESHTLKDELCGDHVVISTDILKEYIGKIKHDVTGVCKKEMDRHGSNHRYCEWERPLVEAILLMNTMKNGTGTGDTDELDTSDNIRETDLGETHKFKPFGGIKIDTS